MSSVSQVADPKGAKIAVVERIDLSAEMLLAKLLSLPETHNVCVLDSCGLTNHGSRFLIAGYQPAESVTFDGTELAASIPRLNSLFKGRQAVIFTAAYELGELVFGIRNGVSKPNANAEPLIYASVFDRLVVHDYLTGDTFITGDTTGSEKLKRELAAPPAKSTSPRPKAPERPISKSNFSRGQYVAAVSKVKEYIRAGDTYQANLTQQLSVDVAGDVSPAQVFDRLRRDHPAAFSAFIQRGDSAVISASPERFFCLGHDRVIEAAPIKGTRPRGTSEDEDRRLRDELLSSSKDRAENVMIVDLLRNDLGRICEFGSIKPVEICSLETHPTLFHLVSRVQGKLRQGTEFFEMFSALFPCGSITGAPKIRTMEIIRELEPDPRGHSMGAVGCYIPPHFGFSRSVLDLSVAIRTIVLKNGRAIFNVGGGITIDSDPEKEYEESLLKAKALLAALGADPPESGQS